MSFNTLIDCESLAAQLGDIDLAVADCRFNLVDTAVGVRNYSASHIPGAVYANLDTDLSSPITPSSGRHPLPEPEAFRQTLGHWGISPDTRVVAYDDAGGAIASRLWWLLRWLGHHEVAVLDGGWDAWNKAGLPVNSDTPNPTAAEYSAQANRQQWLDVVQLQEALAENTCLLLDARAGERFRGEQEPLDTVAGHVPGAVNSPLGLNLDGQGLFRAPDELKERYLELLAGRAPRTVVHMCGSGVTACHNMLAMENAGLSGSKIYPGSWSEWIRDESRPITSG